MSQITVEVRAVADSYDLHEIVFLEDGEEVFAIQFVMEQLIEYLMIISNYILEYRNANFEFKKL